ncbi:LOW QUALITY PROTEIN: putative leucine-rich repeat-containing protein DDB_G0290503 [Chelonus insularis]|uniref:LOW QUALITY PROTEIN: putative leucine-rich repeat-containing protein DDB_G0290503 n=1 Tax=Chelonus insularis TaxID=460826 RepID=UPI0015882DC9|nr:LOW QUALITY PROTEIN: putative leucine-rich repeat-containing protein DDB_G0290503 [Chelonus insularis]
MPRTKESDDEYEIKTGRRSRAATGTNVVDSPLRRSTRNRQQINRELSPDGVNITSGPVTRTTRRKAASQEVFTSESTRTLRPRKTSVTSDTSENHDVETADSKRTTKKSTTAAATSDTPTNIRLRRSVRAGSESKTIQSPAKANRLTRASSLDLEERDNEIQNNLQEAHNSTPIKLRRRASILPSEPTLIEEIEKDRNSLQESLLSIIEDDQKEKEINDTEDKHSTVGDFAQHTDSIKSPILRLSRGFTPEVEIDTDQSNENTNDTSTNPLKISSGCSLKSISEEINDSQLKEESTICNKNKSRIHEIIQTPKVVVEKMKFPFEDHTSESLDVSPNNKENQKSNVTIPIKKLKFPNSEEVSTHRKSLTTIASEKISIVKRLNKTIDDKMLITNENSSNESLPKKSFEFFSNIKMINENVFSVNIGSKNESIIITEKIKESNFNVQNSENSNIEQEESLKDTSSNSSINDNYQIYKKNNVIDKSLSQNNEILKVVIDEEEIGSLKEKSQIMDETSNVKSLSIESAKARKEIELNSLTVEEVNSSVDEPENDKSDKGIILENDFEDELPINKAITPSKEVEENDRESNKSIDNELDYDLNQLFKDIPADEWNKEPIQSSENNKLVEKNLKINTKKQENEIDDKKEEKNFEKESIEDFELVLVDKKAWEAAEADRLKKIKEVHNFESLDTIQTDTSFQKSIDPPASPLFEELTDVEENEKKSEEVQQVFEEVTNSSNNSLLEQVNNDERISDKSNDNIENEHETKETLVSNSLKKEVKLKQITPSKFGFVTNSKKLVTEDRFIRQSLDSLLSQNTTFKTTSSKTRKSLNPSIKLDNFTSDTNERNKINSSTKFLENSSNKSLNTSEPENIYEIDTEKDEEKKKEDIDKSLNQSISKKTKDKLHKSPYKEKVAKNLMSQVNIDPDMQSIDSENESDDQTITLPAFLYGESSDSSNQQKNDSSSTDSDIAREYNLNGDSVLEYSDDNVSEDICHASETESTESDEEDDDMADFIVDDDEEIEEEMEDEESESKENKSDSDNEKENIINNNENKITNDENESNEEIGDDETYEKFEENKNELFYKNMDVAKHNKQKENQSTHSKPIILQENDVFTNENRVLKMIKSKVDKSNTPQLVKFTKKDTLTPLKKSIINFENSFNVDDSPITLKSPKISSVNKSMLPPCTTSPETLLLLKEKLNDTLPPLKLEKSGKKRKSSLYFVEDAYNDKPAEMGVNKEPIDKIGEVKYEKKKQKKITKCEQHGFSVEDISTEIHESSQLSKISHKNFEKQKKKVLRNDSFLNSNVVVEKENKKKKKGKKSVETKKNKEKIISIKEINQTSTKKMKKIEDSNKNNVDLKRTKRLSSETYYTAEEADTDSIKNLNDYQKSNKLKSNLPKFTNSETEQLSSVQSTSTIRHKVKRLPDDVIEGLLEIPVPPKKKRKLLVDQKVLPSRQMFDSEHPKPENISIEDEGYIPLSSSGGTTSFYVMNLDKPKKSKKLAAVYSFRERMLRRNQRQPISAYLIYQQKLKAAKNGKY